MDISNIIVTLDYLLRMAMDMLDKVMKTLGISLPTETTTVEETTTAAE